MQPLRIRLDEVLQQEYLRICRRQDDPLFKVLQSCLKSQQFMNHRVLTPVHMISMASRETSRHVDFTNVEQATVEKTEHVTLENFTEFKLLPDTVGSSKSRSSDQAKTARTTVINYLQSTAPHEVIAFTDGSALGNPGPCGAAAAVYIGSMDADPVELSCPVSKHSSSYHGELHAILLVLQFIVQLCQQIPIRKLHIFCDCQSAIQVVCSSTSHINFSSKLLEIQQLLRFLHNSATDTIITWVGGHISLEPNDLADRLAKEAAAQAKNSSLLPPLCYSELKNIIRKTSLQKWQKYWSNSTTGNFLKDISPAVPSKRYKSIGNKISETRKLRLTSGHNKLKVHLHKLGFTPTPACECGNPEQSEDHILLHCEQFDRQRETLIDQVERLFIRHNIPLAARTINTSNLLVPDHSLPAAVREGINLAVYQFLGELPNLL